MEQILKLENDDDITSIRSRVEFALPALTRQAIQEGGRSQPARLLIIIPRRNKALRNLVNMKLLARVTTTRNVQLAVISSHPAVRDYARASGIKAFGALWQARLAGWGRGQTPVAPTETQAAVVEVTQPDPVVTPSRKKKAKKQPQKRVTRRVFDVFSGENRPGLWRLLARQLGALILLFVLALIVVLGGIVLLPQGTVTITPLSQPVDTKLVVKADPALDAVDFETLSFPARVAQVELELSSEIDTAETELAEIGLATGQIVFINRTEEEQTIPLSTTISTSAGNPVEFITSQTTTIPSGVGATTSTLVIAVEPGPSGNVRVGQINNFVDPANGRLARVVNEIPTGGGSLEPAKIVVQDDKIRLEAHLRQRVQQEGLRQLQDSLAEQEFIPPESVQVIVLDVQYREFSGDFSDTFGGEMQAVVRATVIGGYNANRLALAGLKAQVPPNYELDLEGLSFSAGEVLNIEERIVTLRVFGSGQAIPVIDAHQVAEDVAWLPIGEAQALLNQQYQLATVPGVELQPSWLVEILGRLPFAPLRIKVIINDAVSLVAAGS